MNFKNALLFLFIFAAGLLAAQDSLYNLSEYKARYERRPAMALNGQANFSGNYQKNDAARNTLRSSANILWQEFRNTDALISSWRLSSRLSGDLGRVAGGTFSNERYHTASFDLSLGWERLHYYRESRFRGWGGAAQAYGALSSFQDNSRNLDLGLAPSVFIGSGRIEFAEDALLARWMLEDLQQAGAAGGYGPEDIAALARTITDIIGNRTFDFRRRRIYELDRLQSTLVERGVAEGGDFALFAILNDNWVFANRSILPHGNRIAYGLQAEAFSRWNRSGDFSRSRPDAYGLAFVEYVHARIINNRGGGQWTARAEGGYFQSWEKATGLNWKTDAEGPFAQVRLGYTHRWLPSSRTALAWVNEAAFTWGFSDDPPFISSLSGKQGRWNSILELDYFINYQWAFNLRASAAFLYEQRTDTLLLSPGFNFSTLYYFF